MNIRTERTTQPRPKPPAEELGFGRYFSDHVFRARYDAERRWHDAVISPYASFALDPAASVLHYGQSVFEGLKAFIGPNGRPRLFRPDVHAARMVQSARRICLPEVPVADFLEAAKALVDVDRGAIPQKPDTSLYLRPTLVGTEGFLGVRPSSTADFFIIASPVGSYWQGGRRPLRIWVESELVRAAPGGAGAAKFAGNYATSLLAADRARGRGFDQVLWTDAHEHARVEEIGTMNLFVRIGSKVITPPLDGTILPGVTRDCVLRLLREWGVTIEERALRLDEIEAARAAGTLREMFGTGTAAVIAPIGILGLAGREVTVGNGEEGEITTRLYDTIRGIQSGAVEDKYGWLVEI